MLREGEEPTTRQRPGGFIPRATERHYRIGAQDIREPTNGRFRHNYSALRQKIRQIIKRHPLSRHTEMLRGAR